MFPTQVKHTHKNKTKKENLKAKASMLLQATTALTTPKDTEQQIQIELGSKTYKMLRVPQDLK